MGDGPVQNCRGRVARVFVPARFYRLSGWVVRYAATVRRPTLPDDVKCGHGRDFNPHDALGLSLTRCQLRNWVCRGHLRNSLNLCVSCLNVPVRRRTTTSARGTGGCDLCRRHRGLRDRHGCDWSEKFVTITQKQKKQKRFETESSYYEYISTNDVSRSKVSRRYSVRP